MQNRGWKLGLERMQAFVDRAGLRDCLGGPSGPQFIHVAGTNGKGSVTAYIQSALVEAGYRTGAFFSPYVVDPRERIQFGRQLISEDELIALVETLYPIGEALADTPLGAISEFELKTGMGFAYWREKNCEWVALEVGLGGRLDSTNVVSPRGCAIVSIGLDHCQILGHTLREIAYEKAGILKPGVPCVVGEMDSEALSEIERIGDEVGAPLLRVGREVRYERVQDGVLIRTPYSEQAVQPAFQGPIQWHNAAVAYATLEASGAVREPATIAEGIRRASAPGRFQRVEYRDVTAILDGAHNAEAGRALTLGLEEIKCGAMPIVLGMVAGHEIEPFVESLRAHASHVLVAPIDFHRALPTSDLCASIRAMGISADPCLSVEQALHEAAALASVGGHFLVTGSFYLVGEALRVIERELILGK